MNNWRVIQTDKLVGMNQDFKRFLMINEKLGFLFGTDCSDDILLNKKFDEQNAVIYKTTDGGKNWDRKELCKGEIVSAFVNKDVIYCVSNLSNKDYYAIADTSLVFASYDRGNTWLVLSRFPYYVREVKFYDPQIGIAVVKKQKEKENFWRVLKTIDSGKTWSEIFSESDVQSPVLRNDTLWYVSNISEISPAYKEKYALTGRNMLGEIVEKYEIPLNFNFRCFSVDDNQDFWLGGVENQQTVLYKSNLSGNFSKVKVFEEKGLFPEVINIYQDTITLITGKILGLGVGHRVYISDNDEKKWKRNDPLMTDVMNPIAFYKNSIWAYAGAGMLQVKN